MRAGQSVVNLTWRNLKRGVGGVGVGGVSVGIGAGVVVSARSIYGGGGAVPPVSTATPSGKKVERKKFSVLDLIKRKETQRAMTMVTAYDCPSAQHCEAAECDMALVGDSAANVIQGKESTTAVTMDEMVLYCQQVSRQCKKTMVIGDMPFGSYTNELDAVRNAVRLVKEGGVDAVKLEGGRRVAKCVSAISNAGIVVFGHIGVTPQTSAEQGGFRVQGKTMDSAMELVEAALLLQEAGASAIVLEMVSSGIAMILTQTLRIPTIGIGSGPQCDGQVLVYHDMLGLLRGGHQPSFAKSYAHLFSVVVDALKDFKREVETREFPSRKHSFLVPSQHVENVRHEMVARKLITPVTPSAVSNPLPRKICVIGGGAMGSLFSALLARVPGVEVTMVTSFMEHMRAINAMGGIVLQERSTMVTCPVKAVTEPPPGSTADLVIILVKSYDTPRAASIAARLMDPNSVVLSLQNGVGHSSAIHAAASAAKTLLGVTSMAARLTNQLGAVVSTGFGPTVLSPAGFSLSDLTAGTGLPEVYKHSCEKASAVNDLFVAADLDVKVAVSREQMEGAVYSKLLVNSVINSLTAVHGVPNGHLLLPAFRPMVDGLCAETYSVLHGSGKLTMNSAADKVNDVIQATAENESSMLADVRRGVRTEVDVINGTVVTLARSVMGSDAPFNRYMVRKVNALLPPGVRTYSTTAAHKPIVVCRDLESMLEFRERLPLKARVGFVPTMGGLHSGHLDLARRAREENEVVVASIYVNPTQFAAHEDLSKYPRDLSGDLEKLAGIADCVFAPHNLYTEHHSTFVIPVDFTSGEGVARPGHFRGVATIVTKLFNIVQPSCVYFGQKDAQQCIVVRRLIADLNMNIRLTVLPTTRASDGLALSTRNQYLTSEQRAQAPILYAALQQAAQSFVDGRSTAAALRAAFLARMADLPMVDVQYFSVSSNETGAELEPQAICKKPLLISAAIRWPNHQVRLLDNIVIH